MQQRNNGASLFAHVVFCILVILCIIPCSSQVTWSNSWNGVSLSLPVKRTAMIVGVWQRTIFLFGGYGALILCNSDGYKFDTSLTTPSWIPVTSAPECITSEPQSYVTIGKYTKISFII